MGADHITLYVPSGMGDLSWVYSKIVTLGRKIKIVIVADGSQRVSQLVAVLPMLEGAQMGRLSYPQLRMEALPPGTGRATIEAWDPGKPIPLQANDHIVDQPGGQPAQRIESWLPDVPIDHHYQVDVPADPQVDKWLSGLGKYVCVYGANDGTIGTWGGWQHSDWFSFMSLVYKAVPELSFVMIGSNFDRPLSERLSSVCAGKIPLLNLVGQTRLHQALDLILRSVYFVGFPAGLPVYAEVMRHPVYMFYPKALESMIDKWPDPAMIADKSYMGSVFRTPGEVWGRIVNEYKFMGNIGFVNDMRTVSRSVPVPPDDPLSNPITGFVYGATPYVPPPSPPRRRGRRGRVSRKRVPPVAPALINKDGKVVSSVARKMRRDEIKARRAAKKVAK